METENTNFIEPRSRLIYLLNLTKLRQNEFAERVGLSPATISHIMSKSGRHASLTENIADSILVGFPDLNINRNWLLTGLGEPILQSINEENERKTLDLLDLMGGSPPAQNEVSTPLEVKNDVGEQVNNANTNELEKHNVHSTPRDKRSEIDSSPLKKEQKIVRVILFYDDKTFIDYRPQP